LNYAIRLATAEDVQAIAEIGGLTFAKADGDIVLASDMDSYVTKFFDPEFLKHEITSKTATYFVAVDRQGVIGYAKMAATEVPDELADQQVVELIRLYVRPGCYGRGVGGALLDAVKQHAAATEYTALWLRVWQKNEGAIRLYERDGFSRLSIEPYYIGTTANPVVLMLKRLT